MSECPDCERHKQRIELWRQEAYRLSERQWVGLTDEETAECFEAKVISDRLKADAKRIEAKLKEKNT